MFDANAIGIGLRTAHYQDILTEKPELDWLEVHSENYFGKGGKPLDFLKKIHQHYPLSFHGVGLSLGSVDDLNKDQLKKIKKLIYDFSPVFVSEHLSWSSINAQYFHDLFPLPLTEESLALVKKHVDETQHYLNHQILIENISSYLQFTHSTLTEYEFLSELSATTGCGILLDINNLYINSMNHLYDSKHYLKNLPYNHVHQMHLAGFTRNITENGEILIDTHNQPIAQSVWELYAYVVEHFGGKPTLIEWDKDIPALSVLLDEANKAKEIMECKYVIA